MKGEIFNLLYSNIYETIFRVYCLIPDHTKALIYGRKLLDIYGECGKKDEERNLLVKLANIYLMQYKYLKARELYDKAINIMKEMGGRKNEKVGIISCHLCDYHNASVSHLSELFIPTEVSPFPLS